MDGKNKKNLYLALWLVLGALLGTLVGEVMELIFVQTHDEVMENTIFIYGGLIVLGIAFGIWAGPIAWRKIYVEGVRGKKYVVKGAK